MCKSSFLSLWSFALPLRSKGKELCDVLVVFDRTIVIFSVKEILFDDNAGETVARERWKRRAIYESVRQIRRAERWIIENRPILTHEGKPIPVSSLKDAKIYRVGVALGSKGRVTLLSQDFGKGYIHFYDEVSFHILLQELDTITDFVGFLTAVESIKGQVLVNGGDENLLALYLQNNRSFPSESNLLVIGGDLWQSFDTRPEVRKRREEDKVGYLWDGLIETVSRDVRDGTLEYVSKPGDEELVLRTMARENRFNRRILGDRVDNVLRTTEKTKRRAQIFQSPSGITYVLLLSERARDRNDRRAELGIRCFIARDLVPASETVVGIATEHYDPGDLGFSIDTCYLRYDDWTPEHHKTAMDMQNQLGYFKHAELEHVAVDEYPNAEGAAPLTVPRTPEEASAEKIESLQQKFPVTTKRLFDSKEFEAIARQLALEKYEGWKILEAGCSIVMRYQVNPTGKTDPMQLGDQLTRISETYVDTVFSPFPPPEFFSLKVVRHR